MSSYTVEQTTVNQLPQTLQNKQNVGDYSTNDNVDNKLKTNVINYTTNRILEIPQDIKAELNNGVITIKAGTKVYIPNGFERKANFNFSKAILNPKVAVVKAVSPAIQPKKALVSSIIAFPLNISIAVVTILITPPKLPKVSTNLVNLSTTFLVVSELTKLLHISNTASFNCCILPLVLSKYLLNSESTLPVELFKLATTWSNF